jgi:prepilin-type processing-associated H-X9-DG protein/prepilin-type N-terminal cleavage/methylation domain-containing protein
MSRTSGAHQARRQAFTLVELLVVIGIIAVLVAILFPVLGKAREQAERVRCASNLRQFAQADEVYVNETKGWHLPGFWDNNPTLTGIANKGYQYNRTWPGIFTFRRYLDMPVTDEAVATGKNQRCYVDRAKWYCPTMNKDFAPNNEVYEPTVNTWFLPMNYSYGMNVTGIDEDNAAHGSTPDNPKGGATPNGSQDNPAPIQVTKGFHGYNRSQVKRPSEKLMFVDAYSQALVNVWGSGVFPGWNGKVSNYDDVFERSGAGTLPDGRPYDSTRMTAWRHRNGANVCYFDGHVQWLHKDFIYTHDSAGNPAPNWGLWDVMR